MDTVKNKNAIACFIWRIPKHFKCQINLLTHGYIMESLKIIQSIIIPNEIIELFCLYWCDDNRISNNLKTGSKTIVGFINRQYSDVLTYQSLNARLTLLYLNWSQKMKINKN